MTERDYLQQFYADERLDLLKAQLDALPGYSMQLARHEDDNEPAFVKWYLSRFPKDGLVKEDTAFVVNEVSKRHIVVSSITDPEVKVEIDISQPAPRSYAFTPIEARKSSYLWQFEPDDFK